MRTQVLAIIPARGGSKSIPRKNVMTVAGQPLIAHTIQSAQKAKCISRIVVSTEDPEIGLVAERYGAQVVWRPLDISGDTAPSELALLHTLDFLEKSEGYVPDIIVFLQCTSPLTSPEDIDGTVRKLLDGSADSALAVIPFHYFLWKCDSLGNAVGINHAKESRPMRQQREPQFKETGGVYAMRTQGFKEAKHRFFGRTALHVTPPEHCLEIDEPSDVVVSETLLRLKQRDNDVEHLPCPVQALAIHFEGIFTDDRVLMSESGQKALAFSRSDRLALAGLNALGLPMLAISDERNPMAEFCCRELGIEYVFCQDDKLRVLEDWLSNRGIDRAKTIYLGNDVTDISCMQHAGCGAAVCDCESAVQNAARIVLRRKGGRGAVCELAGLIMQIRERGTSV